MGKFCCRNFADAIDELLKRLRLPRTTRPFAVTIGQNERLSSRMLNWRPMFDLLD